VAFVVLAITLGVLAIVHRWADFRDSLSDLSWPVLVAAFALGVGNIGTAGIAWWVLLRDLGSHLPLPAALRVFFVSQLGKYLPGSVWPLLAQAELGLDRGVPRRRSVVVGLVTIGTSLAAGLLVACATLPFAAPQAAASRWWALLALPILLVMLHPRVIHACAQRGLRLLRRPELERPISLPGLAAAMGVQVIGWMLIGMQVALLAIALGAPVGRVIPLALGGTALAWCAGLLAIPVPAGVGIREATLVAALAPVLPAGAALVVALVSRVLATVGDGLWAAAGLAMERRRHVDAAPATAPEHLDAS
jgi:uncharacterized membrane protein YbhN (UPF0104 family)